MRLKGANVIVTGASRGIGRAIALRLASEGAVVGINYRTSAGDAKTLRDEIVGAGMPEPVLLEFDACDSAAMEKGVAHFAEKAGGLGALVNNASVNISGLLPVIAEEEIARQIESALMGPILMCRHALPLMLRARCGSIVNIGTAALGRGFRGQTAYASAKGGLAAFTRSLALEYARKGIRVNCVQPGPVKTGMMKGADALAEDEVLRRMPIGRYIAAEEVASTVAFLVSGESSGITGACIDVDGGMSL